MRGAPKALPSCPSPCMARCLAGPCRPSSISFSKRVSSIATPGTLLRQLELLEQRLLLGGRPLGVLGVLGRPHVEGVLVVFVHHGDERRVLERLLEGVVELLD